MRIRFTTDARLEKADGTLRASYSAGEVVEVDASTARRWLRRGMAEVAEAEPIVQVVRPVAMPVVVVEAATVEEPKPAPLRRGRPPVRKRK